MLFKVFLVFPLPLAGLEMIWRSTTAKHPAISKHLSFHLPFPPDLLPSEPPASKQNPSPNHQTTKKSPSQLPTDLPAPAAPPSPSRFGDGVLPPQQLRRRHLAETLGAGPWRLDRRRLGDLGKQERWAVVVGWVVWGLLK